MFLIFFACLYIVVFVIIPALMLKAVISIINNSDSDLSESVRTNLKTVLISYATSIVLLWIFGLFYSVETVQIDVFPGVVIMGYFSFIAFILLYILSYIRKSFQWSDVADLLCKLIATVIFYIPVYYFLSLIEGLQSFTFWSLAGTLAVILLHDRELFAKGCTHFSNNNFHQR